MSSLPPITAFLLFVSRALAGNIEIILLLTVSLLLGVRALAKNKRVKEGLLDKLVLKIPLASALYIKNLMARFALSMSILLKSGVTLVVALKVSAGVSGNSVFRNEISREKRSS